ncbi:MAG: UbiD family decarboxylase [Deltaproteobacteria bacterium]|nr:UbiD family decarboxylase [Deltaproteobacteria bacterium]
MEFNDLREYIQTLQTHGEIKILEGAKCDLEIGAITELASSIAECPAVLFDSIQGYSKGYRVLTNFLTNRFRERLVYGVSTDLSDSEAVKYWKEKLKEFHPVQPVEVKGGPVKENVKTERDVDLRIFPWPQWHERDGGPYVCATSVVTRDPESSYINVGSYRFMLVNKNTIVAHIGSGHHGDVIRKKYWAKGKPCPAAISLGQEPALLVAAGTNLSWGVSEYGFAGWMRGAPVEVTKGVATDLPIPATAEVVLEGDMLPPEEGEEVEGPFGEFSGYYGGGARAAPKMVIKSMLYRKDPIILGAPPFLGASRGVLSSRGILVWNELEALGIPNILGVNYSWGMTIVSIKQAYPGHAMRVAHGALGGTAGYHGRFVIVVDEDIDPFNVEEVLWAVATRCDPETSLDVCRRIWSYKIDPRLPREKKDVGNYTGSVAIIDACRPYHWIKDFPATTKISEELLRKTDEKWGKFLRVSF